ncbi:MAG: glycerol-3-phosphate acyltransferase [Actinomycetota bacterium]|nr:glycerol-3-phosphate acyltransferase [Actinomycetota bacterium]
MLVRVVCLAIGYAFGCFLTADIVARMRLGKPAHEVGSGNPGMANIASLLGTRWAAVVLIGDVGKVLVPFAICRFVLFPDLGQVSALWVGLGATLGHDFPFWMGFHGGKGVSTTCATIVFNDPVGGLVSCVVGLLVVLATKQLCFGAVAITFAFAVFAFLHGWETFALACVLAVLMAFAHGRPMLDALAGRGHRTDLLAQLRRR